MLKYLSKIQPLSKWKIHYENLVYHADNKAKGCEFIIRKMKMS